MFNNVKNVKRQNKCAKLTIKKHHVHSDTLRDYFISNKNK